MGDILANLTEVLGCGTNSGEFLSCARFSSVRANGIAIVSVHVLHLQFSYQLVAFFSLPPPSCSFCVISEYLTVEVDL